MTLAWICYLVILRKNLGIPCSRRFEQETDIPFKLSLQIVIFFRKIDRNETIVINKWDLICPFPERGPALKNKNNPL